MEICNKATLTNNRVQCSLYNRFNSLGVCYECSSNTSTDWPNITPVNLTITRQSNMSQLEVNIGKCVRCTSRREELCLQSNTPYGDNAAKNDCPLDLFVDLTVSAPLTRVEDDKWPKWANYIKEHYAKPEDVGIGDTIERNLGFAGEIFKATLQSIGITCGCDRRKETWNIMYSYKKES